MPRAKFIDVFVTGFPEVTTALRNLSPVVQGKVVRPAMRAGARVAMMRARGLAPRHTRRLATGDWKVKPSKRRNFVGSVVLSPTRRSLGIKPEATGYYPTSQNWGWLSGRRAILGLHGLRRTLTRATREAIEAAHAKATGRRRIPGKRFMQQALFGYLPMIYQAVAAEAQSRLLALKTADFTEGSTGVLLETG